MQYYLKTPDFQHDNDLKHRSEKKAANIQIRVLNVLVRDMTRELPMRVQAVPKNKGGNTKF